MSLKQEHNRFQELYMDDPHSEVITQNAIDTNGHWPKEINKSMNEMAIM